MEGAVGVRWAARLRNDRELWLLVAVTSEQLLLEVTFEQPGWESGALLVAGGGGGVGTAGTRHDGGDSYCPAAAVDGGVGDEGNPLSLMTSLDDDVAVDHSSAN